MHKTGFRLLVVCTAFSMLAAIGCGKKDGDSDGDKKNTTAGKSTAFRPGKLVQVEDKNIGFSILKPEAVVMTAKGDTAELKAKGFPTITITLHKTKDASASGTSGGGGMGKYKRKVYAPMRKLVCECTDMGTNEELVKQICKSMKNTKSTPKKPSVKFDAPKVEGKFKAQDVFVKQITALQPKISECWNKAVAADAKFPKGHINVQITYKKDGSRKQWGLTRTFNYKEHKPLTDCVEKLVMAVKPEPDGGEVKLGWYLRFKLY